MHEAVTCDTNIHVFDNRSDVFFAYKSLLLLVILSAVCVGERCLTLFGVVCLFRNTFVALFPKEFGKHYVKLWNSYGGNVTSSATVKILKERLKQLFLYNYCAVA